MTTKFIKLFSIVGLLTLAGCKYSNQFTGTYNNEPAKVQAYSSNVGRYCISLNISTASLSKNNFISSSEVMDENDWSKPKSFNTKGTQCNANQTEYLVGTRIVNILNAYETSQVETRGIDMCQVVYYKEYQYQEKINFSTHAKDNDAMTGTFDGIGQVDFYTDFSRPTRYGQIFFCGRPGGFPGGCWPNSCWPGGFPRGPGPFPRW